MRRNYFKISLSQMVGKSIIIDYLLINDLPCIFPEFTQSFFRNLFFPLGTLSLSIMLIKRLSHLSCMDDCSLEKTKNICPGG
uniref:Uncharacterized protein n=1 Tax=Lepeophtheirus salmonis TaxID=72036 RepID=A0A0K2UFY8_LEPSM